MVVDSCGSGSGLLSASGGLVQVCVHVQFGNVFNNSREAFMDQLRAA